MIKVVLLALAMLGTAVPAIAQSDGGVLVRTITKGGVNIKYYRQNDTAGVGNTQMRICLQNMTGTPKSMVWTRVTPQWNMKNIVAAPRTRVCAVVPVILRLEWNFVDGTTVRLSEAMSLGGFRNDAVIFEWQPTRAELVRACEQHRCAPLATAGANSRPNEKASSAYGIATVLCSLMCGISN